MAAAWARTPHVHVRTVAAVWLGWLLVTVATAAAAVSNTTFTASDGFARDNFGRLVLIRGRMVVVAINGYDNAEGQVYVFECAAGARTQAGGAGVGCTEQAKLRPETLAPGAMFGESVAIGEHDAIYVAAPYVGVVYIFECDQTVQPWRCAVQLQLEASAYTIAVAGPLLAAPIIGGPVAGVAVYQCGRKDGPWACAAVATVLGGQVPSNNQFGRSVTARSDGTIFVGAPSYYLPGAGLVWVFRCDQSVLPWRCEYREVLAPSDDEANRFGFSVAVDVDVLVVGQNDANGSLHVYECPTSAACVYRVGVVGTERGGLGDSVAVRGLTVFGGASSLSTAGAVSNGGVYVYECTRSSTAPWSCDLVEVLSDDNSSVSRDSMYLGYAVAVDGSLVVAGGPYMSSNPPSLGRAYVFEVTA